MEPLFANYGSTAPNGTMEPSDFFHWINAVHGASDFFVIPAKAGIHVKLKQRGSPIKLGMMRSIKPGWILKLSLAFFACFQNF
jgi:hypothetical protein